MTTETGGACSATAIRALIKQLVGEEDTKRPLSDSQISEILGKQGIVVARRTMRSIASPCRSCRSTCASRSERIHRAAPEPDA